MHQHPLNPARSCGFSLIELILVLVLLGILAAIAVPRFAGTGESFAQAAFEQQLKSALRYAQQTAVAQNRPVTIEFSSAGFEISFSDNNNPLRNPADGKPFNTQPDNPGRAPDNINFSANGTIRFDGLGRPWNNGDLLTEPFNIGINNTTLHIAPQTGTVYEP